MSAMRDIFRAIGRALAASGTEAVLIGGFAVNYYGYTRSTVDIDFMIASDDVAALSAAMRGEGFTSIQTTENVAFFGKPDLPIRIDFLQVDASTMQELLTRAVVVEFRGQSVKVPALEDLLAMKLFALKHGWDRRVHKDLPDIAHLVVANRVDEQEDLQPLCAKYGDDRIYEQVVHEIGILKSC